MKTLTALLHIVLFLICFTLISMISSSMKYYDKEEVLELFQSENPDVYIVEEIFELESRIPRSSLFTFDDIVEIRTPSIDGQNENYIWVFIYDSESSLAVDLENSPLNKRNCFFVHDKNIIICDWEGNAGALLDVCETLFPETYQKTS